MSKSKPKVKKEDVEGCENCSNTGLEPGVARDTAQVCPVCNGSPFGEKVEVKNKSDDEESEDNE